VNTPDLQNLLQRCESDDATSAEIAALGALLQGQEQQEDWQGIRQGLQLGLSAEAEGFELAEDLARVVHPQAAWSAIASALRLGLPPAAGRADVARAVVHHVAPHAEAGLPRAVEALERGLAREARHGDVAQLVMARVLPGAEPELCAARAALRVGLRLEAAQADLADKIVAQALPERDQQLEQAAAALAWGLAAEAQDIDLSPAVMQLVLAEHSAWVQLSALADGELPVEQRRALAARLAQDASGRRLVNDLLEQGRTLRQALAHETAGVDLSAVWPAVAQQIGVAEQASWASLAQGLREEAGAIDVADAVMAAILPTPAAEPHEPSSSPAAPERQLELAPAAAAPPAAARLPWFRRLPALALLGAAAALLLLLNLPGPESVDPSQPELALGEVQPAAELAFEIGAVNSTQIEDLEVASDAMVQVFQLDEGAPMIIFIEENLDQGESQGVTL